MNKTMEMRQNIIDLMIINGAKEILEPNGMLNSRSGISNAIHTAFHSF